MTLEAISKDAQADHLEIFGACHTGDEDDVGIGTLVLLGPKEPGFWTKVSTTPEFLDGAPDPLDRWSTRVISALAELHNAQPLFPFGSPPRPFIGWALRSGRAWISPIGILVHDRAGLLVSYRGALLLPEILPLPDTGASPCQSCAKQPCRAACPVSALTSEGYDLKSCHSFLDQAEGVDCLARGCKVRCACPVSQTYPRDPAQSGFHMTAFHPNR